MPNSNNKKMTEADKEALEKMPDGWFEPYDVLQILRPDYRCRRLAKMGTLEWVTSGELDNLRNSFKKINK